MDPGTSPSEAAAPPSHAGPRFAAVLPVFLVVLSGLTQAAITPPHSFLAVHPIAFVPALLALREAKGARAFRLGWLWGISTCLCVFWWVVHTIREFSNLPDVLAVLILLLFSAAFGLYLGLFGWLWDRIRDHLGPVRLLGGAALFTALEFLNPQLFPYFQGSVWYQQPSFFLGAAALGVPFLTFQVLLWNFVGAEWLGRWIDRRRGAETAPAVALRWGAGTAAVLLAGTLGFSALRLRSIDAAEATAETLRVALIQTNQTVPKQREMLRRSPTATLDDNVELSWQVLREQGPVDVIIWPEGAIRGAPTGERNWRLRAFVKESGTEVWTGGSSMGQGEDGRRIFYNSAFRVHGDGEVDRRYDKMVLLPFGEFMPFADSIPLLKKIKGPGNYHRGEEPLILQSGPVRFVFLICYEAIQSGHVREMVERGADLLVNITYDAWFGDTTCPHQHLMLSAIQAAQYGRPLVRTATTGITAVVDARGTIVEQTKVFTRDAIVRDVPRVRVDTPYGRIGDLFAWSMVVLSAVAVIRARRAA